MTITYRGVVTNTNYRKGINTYYYRIRTHAGIGVGNGYMIGSGCTYVLVALVLASSTGKSRLR